MTRHWNTAPSPPPTVASHLLWGEKRAAATLKAWPRYSLWWCVDSVVVMCGGGGGFWL